MRVAAIYDIHGNLPALESVLEDIRRAGVDAVVVGGDVVPGPLPRETLARLQTIEVPTHFIQGNGDRMVTEMMSGVISAPIPDQAREVVGWCARQFDAEHGRMLASWPKTLTMTIPPLGEVLFCHATPRNDTEIFTRVTPAERLTAVFAGVTAPTVICGHTHMQFDRMVGTTRVVNSGSVGMPFGPPGAYWLLLGPDIQPQQTHYDFAAAAAAMRATAYPQAETFAGRNILAPPSEREMQETFEKVAVR